MKFDVEFLCSECGLLTPGIAEIPEGVDENRPLRCYQDCHHCDNEMMMIEFTSVKAMKKTLRSGGTSQKKIKRSKQR